MVKRIGIFTKEPDYEGWPYLILSVNGREIFYVNDTLRTEILDVKLDDLTRTSNYHISNRKYGFVYDGINRPIKTLDLVEGVTVASRAS
jgi:hypothetical protein